MLKRLLIGVALLLSLGGVGVLAQDETPTITSPEITAQVVKVGQREFVVDPFYLVNCTIVRRTQELPQSDDEALVATIDVQCFIRDEKGDMQPIEERSSIDQGITPRVDVGNTLISAPQEPQDEEVLDG